MLVTLSSYHCCARKALAISTGLALTCLATANHAQTNAVDKFKYPFYAGVSSGYGDTTWGGLVPSENDQNSAISISTPTSVSEGGAVWGAFAGYEFIPYFAIEAAYMRYPNAKITFDPTSLFTFENDGLTELTSKTETVSLMAKIMLTIPKSDIRIYSSLGAAEVHRSDQINDAWITSPTFGAGVNYNLTEHIMTELAANYTAGNGVSELNPVEDYFPFLYSIFLRVAYRL